MWKLRDNTLVNKANSWKSNEIWALKSTRGRSAYLENVSESKYLVDLDGTLKLMDNNFGQTWEMGHPNKEGYFTITQPTSEKALSASSNQRFQLKGKFLIIITNLFSSYFFLFVL